MRSRKQKRKTKSIISNYESFIAACKYIVDARTTIRVAAQMFGLSKSTLHNFIHKNLLTYCEYVGSDLFDQVVEQLRYNFSQRHIRGGNSTRLVYALKRKQEREDEI